MIATGRVFLAGGALLAAYLGPIRPIQNATLIAGLLVGYLVASVILWVTLRSRPTADPSVCIGAHAADLFCTTALTVLSRGPGSPFFLFFIFVLLAAAYRWGFRGAMLTAGAGVALLAGEAYVLTPTSLPARLLSAGGLRMAQEFPVNELLLRSVYLLLVGLLLGYLAEGENALQSEAATTARVVGRAQLAGGLKATIEGMLDELLVAFGVDHGMIVAEEIDGTRMFVWEGWRKVRRGPLESDVRAVEEEQQGAYRSATEGNGWFAWKMRGGRYRVGELARAAETPVEDASATVSAVPEALQNSGTVLAAPFQLGKQWKGWVYLLDVRAPLQWRKELGFLRRIVDAAAPAAYNAYLLSRMRAQIGAQERGRVARALHDGPIQSLVAAELQVHVMRSRPTAGSAEQADQLDELERLVHEQVLNLRELMEKIRPIDPDPRRLPEFLAEQVEKFQRETGIQATFAGDGAPVRLTGRACRELMLIAQELLFNVRRHSDAARVDVRLSSQDGLCKLEVSDDGRGFDFTGRYDQKALEEMRKGPRVVKERLRTLAGNLEIESDPGKGARLWVTLPQREK